jgi:hypothetical protein
MGGQVKFILCEDFTWRLSDCEELVGEVNHTTESVTDHLSFWEILFATQSYEFYDYYGQPHRGLCRHW